MRFPSPPAFPLVAVAVLAAASPALAETRRVPSQYATLQAAVDDADDGDTIVVSAGDYGVGATVNGRHDLAIRGAGKVILSSGASITVNGSSSGILVRGLRFQGGGVTVLGGEDVVLDRLRFQDGGNAVVSAGVDGLVITRCSFTNIGASGVGDIDSTGLVVEKCSFEDIEGTAVFLSPDNGFGTQSPVLAKNRVRDCIAGFALSGANALVEKNRMEGLAAIGVDTTGFLSTNGARILKNRIETSGNVAIGGAYNGFTVEKNVVAGGGIQFTGGNHFIDGNRITADNGTGIFVTGVATIRGNIVKGTGGAGITVLGAATVLERNSVSDTAGDGIEVHGGGCDVLRNTVARAGGIGILVTANGQILADNRVSGSGVFDLADSFAEGVNTYTDNRFGTTLFNFVD